MDDFISRAEHEEFARRMDDEDKRQNKRLEMVERQLEQVQSIAVSVEKMACNMQAMLEEQKRQGDEQKKQGARLEALESEPGKEWKKFKAGIIAAIAAAIGTGIVTILVNFLK